MKTVTIEEFHALLKEQGVPREHLALKCPMCHTVQSASDLIAVGAGGSFDDVEKYLGFSCVGRWSDSPASMPEDKTLNRGCDWTLDGLFKLHEFEVVDEDGKHHSRFAPVDAKTAQEHMKNSPFQNPRHDQTFQTTAAA